MNKLLQLGLLAVMLAGCSGAKKGTFIVSTQSENSQKETVEKLKKLIVEKELTLFEIIDHQANAKAVNMDLKPETVVVFGNPKMGTVLMRCNPSMGLDLPLRILVSTTYEGVTSLTYTNPEYWSLKHNIKDRNCLEILNKAKIALQNLSDEAGKK